MSKKSKAKKDRHVVDDAPIAPASGRSFPCPRCQAKLTSAAQLPGHQLDAHLLGVNNNA